MGGRGRLRPHSAQNGRNQSPSCQEVPVAAQPRLYMPLRSVEKDSSVEGALVLPASSVARATTRCSLQDSRTSGVMSQAPVSSAWAVPTPVPSTESTTVLPGSAVPEKVGRELKRRWPGVGSRMAGAWGAWVSTLQVYVDGVGSILPTESTARTSSVCLPSAWGKEAGMAQGVKAALSRLHS